MELYLLIAVIILLIINLIILLIQGEKSKNNNDTAQMIAEFDRLKKDTENSQSRLRQELSETTQSSVKSLGSILSDNQQLAGAAQRQKN